jgi:hypothetical protein
MVIVDGASSRATLLIAAARRKTPLRCKQQDGCHPAIFDLRNIFQILMEKMKSKFRFRPESLVPALTALRLLIVQCNKSVDE